MIEQILRSRKTIRLPKIVLGFTSRQPVSCEWNSFVKHLRVIGYSISLAAERVWRIKPWHACLSPRQYHFYRGYKRASSLPHDNGFKASCHPSLLTRSCILPRQVLPQRSADLSSRLRFVSSSD